MNPQKTFFIIITISCFFQLPLVAQPYQKLELHSGCNYADRQEDAEYYAYFPTDKAIKIMEEILQASSIPQINFELKSSNVGTAVATVENGRRYILYSQEFISKIERDAKSRWAVYSIMAHEIGHHLLNHDFAETDPAKRKQMELEADEYSGRILMTLCSEEEEALAAINTLSPYKTNSYYPPVSARTEAIASGWIQQKEDWERQGKNPCGQVMELNFGREYGKRNKAKNVKALVKGEEMIITFDAEGRPGVMLGESFIIVSKYSDIEAHNIEWKTDRNRYGKSRQLIWNFGKDGFTRDQVMKPEDFSIGVFETRKVPYRKSAAGLIVSGSTLIAGGVLTGLGFKKNADARVDYDLFLMNGESNDPVFGDFSRQEFYQETNNKHRNSQILRGIGYGVIGASLAYFIPEIFRFHKGRIGFLYAGENGFGVKTRFY